MEGHGSGRLVSLSLRRNQKDDNLTGMARRETGYYWVQFDWVRHGRSENRWEPASWDAAVNAWVMMGSTHMVRGALEEVVFAKIGDRIPEPPP